MESDEKLSMFWCNVKVKTLKHVQTFATFLNEQVFHLYAVILLFINTLCLTTSLEEFSVAR